MLSIKEIRSLSDKELNKELIKLKKELLKITYELKTNQREDTDKPKKFRRSIAQIETEFSQRQNMSAVNVPTADKKKEAEKGTEDIKENKKAEAEKTAESSKKVEEKKDEKKADSKEKTPEAKEESKEDKPKKEGFFKKLTSKKEDK